MATSASIRGSLARDCRPRRRQFSSCDQCRHGRKACDGGSSGRPSCATCLRKGKECSYTWLEQRTLAKKKPRLSRCPGSASANSGIEKTQPSTRKSLPISWTVDDLRQFQAPWSTFADSRVLELRHSSDTSLQPNPQQHLSSTSRSSEDGSSDPESHHSVQAKSATADRPVVTTTKGSSKAQECASPIPDLKPAHSSVHSLGISTPQGFLAVETTRMVVADAFVHVYQNSLETCLLTLATTANCPYNTIDSS